jgi:anti-anti-sigma regulatory factor
LDGGYNRTKGYESYFKEMKKGEGYVSRRLVLINRYFNYGQEAIMIICTEGTVAHLQGDLTHSGVTQNIIDLLAASLQKIVSGGEKNIRIDCKRIRAADISGLQLLYVWMQCARFRGVEPALVNLSDNLRRTMQRMGLEQCFTGNSAHPEFRM